MTIKNKSNRLSIFVKRAGTDLSLCIALLLMGLLFSTLSPYFFTIKNLLNIATYTSINTIMAFGVTVALILASMDLSQFAVAAVASMAAALMLQAGIPVAVVIVAVILIGMLLGAINGLIVSKFGVNAIITTLGTQQVFRGLAYMVSEGKNIPIHNEFLTTIGRGSIGGIPIVFLLMILMFLLTSYILKYTGFGRKVYAIGGNKSASYLSGINIGRIQTGGFMYCSACGALGGLLLSSQVGVAMPTVGVGADMDVIAAVVLGGVGLSGGIGKVSSTLLGALLLQVLSNGMTLLSVQSYWQMVIKGIVLVLAVLIDVIRSKNNKK